MNMCIAEGLQIESEQFAAHGATDDIREGLGAWIDRRPPAYAGR